MAEESGPLKPFKFRKKERWCDASSSEDDDHNRRFHLVWNLHRWQTKNILMRLENSRIHSLPPDLGPGPIIVDKSKVTVTPRVPYALPTDEYKYQKALEKSWKRANRLLGMDPAMAAPIGNKEFDPTKGEPSLLLCLLHTVIPLLPLIYLPFLLNLFNCHFCFL